MVLGVIILYMNKSAQVKYYAVFEPAQEGGYNVSFPDFPGCVTFGNTFEEAKEMACDALSLWIEELEANKIEVPKYDARPIIDEISVLV